VSDIPSGANYACGRHRAFAYERGGTKLVGELTPLVRVNWRRIRDDISTAQATLGTTECCDLLGSLDTIRMELHITRDDEKVWQGPITRLEYQRDVVDVFADDILWIAKRTPLAVGYNMGYPNVGYVVDRMDWLMRSQTFAKYGNPWRAVLHPIRIPQGGDARSSRATFAWSVTTWEDFDKFAEDMGADYTVVNRDIYYWDLNYAWSVLPDLTEDHLSETPRIVEYGSEFATEFVVTNNQGYAGVAYAAQSIIDDYGYIGMVDSAWNEAAAAEPGTSNVPTPEELAEMQYNAGRQLSSRTLPPVSIVVPEGTSLMPSSPWRVSDLIPGSWFNVRLENLCRKVHEAQRLHEVNVTEEAGTGEKFGVTVVTAPLVRINP